MNRILRMTHQREVILAELNSSQTHPTADALYERIKKILPRISLATVYRNLEILSVAGHIQKLEISGRQKRFDRNPESHNHVYCIRCQRIDNISVPDVSPPSIEPRQDKGYTITGCRIEFFGLCPECQKQTKHTAEKGVRTMDCTAGESAALNDQQRQVLEALAKTPEACGSKEIAAATGLDAKQVSSQITVLKNKGFIASPSRCKYALTEQGKGILV